MQRTCHPLFIVESSPARTCQRAGDGGTARPPVWGTYGTDLGLALLRGGETQEHRGDGFKEGLRGGGT
ncbi:hypothetical protein DPMN_045978 [Dreissena polymorpha]|uniref:Uncharacterized protein n=1 Tax=Dreissena polymorpha TaxID=45954 RepID=A0A9D4D7J3_DREPO|nr:hypothetical protein DPMN_045978 [Dreissena polymorpha]